jgi:hypothetical protein
VVEYTLEHSGRLHKTFLEDLVSTYMVKTEKPSVMPPDIQIKVVNNILSMQDLGFSLTVNEIRCVAL